MGPKRTLKFTSLIMSAALLASASVGCSRGVRGIDGVDWNEYDELIAEVREETDAEARNALLRRAEDLLMDTECVTPIYGHSDAYLCRSELTGVYGTPVGAKYFMYAKLALPNGDGDAQEYDNVISAFLEKQPDSFDPALATTGSALTVVENTFSGLFARAEDGSVKPALASDCQCSDDGLTYTVTLREGLLWSDGSPLGASDFVYSWRRAADKSTGSPYAYLFDIIAKNEDGKLDLSADDETDTVLTVKLKTPCGYFTELCAFPAFYPVNETCVESADGYLDVYDNVVDPDAWTVHSNYVTSGAFTFSGTAEGKYIFKKNANFYNVDEMTVDTLELNFGLNADEAYASYTAGDIDYLGLIPRDMHDEVADSGDYHSDSVDGIYCIAYNFNCGVFSGMYADDAALLRRAISLYIDRERITDNVAVNGEKCAVSIIPERIAAASGEDGAREYYSSDTDENRKEARKIIKRLGMDEDGDGVIDKDRRFMLTYLTTDSASDIAIAQSIQQDLSELGIMVKVTAAEESVYDFETSIFNYDMVTFDAASYYGDALSILECWTTEAPGNYACLGSVVMEEDKNAY